jgi:RNA polymerase sigma-70 factor, ECF subfamily
VTSLAELTHAERDGRRAGVIPFPLTHAEPGDPEHVAARAEIRRLIERAADALPAAFRIVFVLREIEQMSAEETARCLGIPAETVKTRLHRAKAKLRRGLDEQLAAVLADIFPFAGARRGRLTAAVLRRLGFRLP